MGGRLKKRGFDRDTVATERALQGIGALETAVGGLASSVGSNKSFNYDVVDVDATPSGVFTEDVPIAATNAVIASCDQLFRIISWSIADGTLTVETADDGCNVRFLVF